MQDTDILISRLKLQEIEAYILMYHHLAEYLLKQLALSREGDIEERLDKIRLRIDIMKEEVKLIKSDSLYSECPDNASLRRI
jgi:hypothetical protein